jgi:7-cyano-7-deazaguanine reductase
MWYVRGVIYTNVVAEHRKPGWTPAPVVQLPQHGTQTGLL